MATCSVRYEPHFSNKACLLKRPCFQSQKYGMPNLSSSRNIPSTFRRICQAINRFVILSFNPPHRLPLQEKESEIDLACDGFLTRKFNSGNLPNFIE